MSLVAQVAFPFSGSSRPKLGGDSRVLLANLLVELLNSAYFTAATISIANAIEARKWPRNTSQFVNMLPPPPKLYPDAIGRLTVTRDGQALAVQLDEYYDQLHYVRTLSARLLELSQIENDIVAVADTWRALAIPAVASIDELLQRLKEHAGPVEQERALFVTDLLVRAAAGESPCLEGSGQITVPAWADRRTRVRAKRGVQVVIQMDDSVQRVGLMDAGKFGIGVLGLKNAAPNARVGLILTAGHTIPGTVVWAEGARAGIKLDQPLPPDSQLLNNLS